MKKIIYACLVVVAFLSCKNNTSNSKFSVNGEIKNLPDQKIYLEELYFNQKDPEVVDTAEVKNGKFTLSALAPEQGLYRLRLEKDKGLFILINDKKEVTLTADINNLSMKTVNINSLANGLLKNFITTTDEQLAAIYKKSEEIKQFNKTAETDSLYNAMRKEHEAMTEGFQKYVLNYIDTSSNAIVTLFALGYTREIDPSKLEKTIAGFSKRFPGNASVTSAVSQFAQMMDQKKQKQQEAVNVPKPGDLAPEITMPDTEGKSFSLSSLRGKYVLVDFWASWCGPCRAENPNVVNAYNKYKDKNFTILGVSLDKDKAPWLEAIKKDGLAWKQVSDLKHWQSAAQKLYQLEGIPYNVLLDPQGKILATSLRGEELESKLAEVLK